jgi:pyridoxal phosphate enzyme (YggS family)
MSGMVLPGWFMGSGGWLGGSAGMAAACRGIAEGAGTAGAAGASLRLQPKPTRRKSKNAIRGTPDENVLVMTAASLRGRGRPRQPLLTGVHSRVRRGTQVRRLASSDPLAPRERATIPPPMEIIADNLERVHGRVRDALRAARRSPETLRLLAVSKTVPAEDVVVALSLGQRDFAESYGQEFRDKLKQVMAQVDARGLPDPLWHFIGPLQTNKVKYVAGKVTSVHTVATVSVLSEIERKAAALGRVQDCLVQVNVAGETQKSGLSPAELADMLDRFAGLSHARCTGLMVIPPYDEDPERSRPHFVALRRLFDQHRGIARPNVALAELSMGMSHDLEVAIAEGATMVRVGTAIFGARA